MRRAWKMTRRARRERRDPPCLVDHADAILDLTASDLTDVVTPAMVGWMRVATDTVKGTDHRCTRCHPTSPHPEAVPVYVTQLAARQPCGTCGQPLEDLAAYMRAADQRESDRDLAWLRKEGYLR